MEKAVELGRTVVRAFCDDAQVVAMDYVLRERVISEEALAERMGVQQKDAARAAGVLAAQRLIGVYVRLSEAEPRRYANYGRQHALVGRTYYYADGALLADATRLRLHRMRRALEGSGPAAPSVAFRCVNCGRGYSDIDAAALVNPLTALFECEACGLPLEPAARDTAAELAGGSAAKQTDASRLAVQTRPIVDLLRQLEAAKLLAIDPEAVIAAREASSAAPADAPADKSEDAQDARRERDAAPVPVHIEVELVGERKRQAELPAWHTHSTVTGERHVEAPAEEAGPAVEKGAGLSAEMDAYVRSYAALAGGASAAGSQSPEEAKRSRVEPQDVVVRVNGAEKRLADVTEADCDAMTPDEYERYYELLSR